MLGQRLQRWPNAELLFIHVYIIYFMQNLPEIIYFKNTSPPPPPPEIEWWPPYNRWLDIRWALSSTPSLDQTLRQDL